MITQRSSGLRCNATSLCEKVPDIFEEQMNAGRSKSGNRGGRGVESSIYMMSRKPSFHMPLPQTVIRKWRAYWFTWDRTEAGSKQPSEGSRDIYLKIKALKKCGEGYQPPNQLPS
jgi:hypothetical protein